MYKLIKKIMLGLGLLLVMFSLTACRNHDPKTVRIGIMSGDEAVWKPIVKHLAKEGITLKLILFTDYNQPNGALQYHELEMNSFQHSYFLNQWNQAHHTHLQSLGATYLAPSRLYSNKIKKVSQLKPHDQIVIPNDATNEGRALSLLQSAKLITLKTNRALPTTKDIQTNPLKLRITPLDSAQTPRSLKDAQAAIVPNDMAASAKLKLSTAIYTEKINQTSKPYVNILVANDRNNPVYQKVVAAYQTEANKKNIQKIYHGTAVAAWDQTFK